MAQSSTNHVWTDVWMELPNQAYPQYLLISVLTGSMSPLATSSYLGPSLEHDVQGNRPPHEQEVICAVVS